MKKIPKTFALLASILLMVCLLSSCGDKAPSEEMVQTDVANSLTASYPFLTLSEMEITQSMTQETIYTATASVTGTGEYAEYSFDADISYMKYDQGWQMNSCYWTELGYEIVTLPSAEQMETLLQTEEYVWDEVREQTYVNAELIDERTLILEGTMEGTCPYLTKKCVVKTSWIYNSAYGTWSFNDVEEEAWTYKLSSALEGTWIAFGGESEIILSNVTEDAFDIELPYYDIGPIHVESCGQEKVQNWDGLGLSAEAQYSSKENVTTSKYGKGCPLYAGIDLDVDNNKVSISALFYDKSGRNYIDFSEISF